MEDTDFRQHLARQPYFVVLAVNYSVVSRSHARSHTHTVVAHVLFIDHAHYVITSGGGFAYAISDAGRREPDSINKSATRREINRGLELDTRAVRLARATSVSDFSTLLHVSTGKRYVSLSLSLMARVENRRVSASSKALLRVKA